MDHTFQKSLFYSFLSHAAILLALFFLYHSFLVVRTPLLMEMTLIGRMPLGNDAGAQNSVSGIPADQSAVAQASVQPPADTQAQEQKPPLDNAEKPEVAVKKTVKPQTRRHHVSPEANLQKLRNSAPIGLNPRKEVTDKIETTAGLGHMGVAGSPEGNANIEGELSARGIKRQVNPAYPDWAKKQGIEAVLKFRITVLPNGFLKEDEIQMDQTSGYRELDHDGYSALIQWEFEPLPQSVPQVNQSGVLTFIFNLKNN